MEPIARNFLVRPCQLICPTGCSAIGVSSPFRKNIPVLSIPKSLLYPSPFRPSGGAYRDRHGRGAECGGRRRRQRRERPFAKIFLFSRYPNHFYIRRRSVPLEGRIAIVTDAGRNAVDAGGAKDESARSRTAKSWGPDAPTLASSWRDFPQTTVARKPGHRGEREVSR